MDPSRIIDGIYPFLISHPRTWILAVVHIRVSIPDLPVDYLRQSYQIRIGYTLFYLRFSGNKYYRMLGTMGVQAIGMEAAGR